MKKVLIALLVFLLICSFGACKESDRLDLTENTFFYGMTTIYLHADRYVGKDISFDCFTYRLTDVNGQDYLLGVRKCSAGYGCNCGKDTIIGFILDYDGDIPEPMNQGEDSADKTWVHLRGTVASAEAEVINIYAYDGDVVDRSKVEAVSFYHFTVVELTMFEDYTGLAYYVTK